MEYLESRVIHSSSVDADLGNSINSDARKAVRVVSQFFKWYNKIGTWNILNW